MRAGQIIHGVAEYYGKGLRIETEYAAVAYLKWHEILVTKPHVHSQAVVDLEIVLEISGSLGPLESEPASIELRRIGAHHAEEHVRGVIASVRSGPIGGPRGGVEEAGCQAGVGFSARGSLLIRKLVHEILANPDPEQKFVPPVDLGKVLVQTDRFGLRQGYDRRGITHPVHG